MVLVVGQRGLDAVHAGEQVAVALRHLGPGREDLVEPLELSEPERGREVVEAVVVAQSRVREPFAGVAASLVGEALQQRPLLLRADRHGSTSPVVICLLG